jgi:hypothetical protein
MWDPHLSIEGRVAGCRSIAVAVAVEAIMAPISIEKNR